MKKLILRMSLSVFILTATFYLAFATRDYCLSDGEDPSQNSYKCQYFLFTGYKCDKEQLASQGDERCAGNRINPIDRDRE